jgi:ParB family transcriptional regulator, chromosome partitioning protein
MKTKRPAMGRGLSALLDSSEVGSQKSEVRSHAADVETLHATSLHFSMIPLERISANPFQPRTVFEEQALQELVESIKKQGIIQPITVRMVGGDRFQLITGGRRYKASVLAELTEIPAYIRVADDTQMLEMALVENIQREDLDPIEIAISFQRLIEECSLTHDALSKNVGKNRTTITNYLRLLKLPAEIQIALRNNKISMGHARALISISDSASQLRLFKDILKRDLSVRKVENFVRDIGKVKVETRHALTLQDIKTGDDELAGNLSSALNTKVDIKRKNNVRGSINIHFNSDEELNRIIDTLVARNR